MKLLDLLKEIGEGSKEPYAYSESKPWSYLSTFYWTTEDDIEYQMSIEKDEYLRPRDIYDIAFGIVKARLPSGRPIHVDYTSTSKGTKTGNLYRTMATVVDIVKKEIELDKQTYKQGPDMLRISPIKDDESDDRRLKLYAAYIKKHIPNAKITNVDDVTFTVDLK